MMVKVEIVSKENIKPSSPTPQTLKSFKLSILDQLIPAPYAPIILFYPNQDHGDGATDLDHQLHTRLETLKDSLSKTLTDFYPLAGTIKDDLYIDCDDVGAYFVVARVNTRLRDFLENPDLELVNHFFPCAPGFNGSVAGCCVTNVQVNVFECHGIAIALCISHKILDGGALSTFLRGWTGSSRGSKDVVIPNLGAPSLFPANDLWLQDSAMVMWGSLLKFGKCSTRRFVFDSSKLAVLKAEAAGNGVKDPTRVEVVSALLWKCAMAAAEEKVGFRKPSMLSHVVNLRKRLASTLSEDSIGNLIWITSSECGPESEIRINDLVERVRGSVSKINGEFVKNIRGDKGREVMEESLEKLKDCGTTKDYIGFTSWCKMGFYEADFGWGKPIWVCGSVSDGSPVFMNFVVLMDMRFGDGIEAWVNMDEQEMEILQHNQELMAFASLDPSPLQTNQLSVF
ncbi:BAHD acyltransferase At5g47980-like [Cynara cardunculus var. scolymus]|uniref:Chloramphenicol acetyltransferase-like domain-containing protein n=1 Tax=Cynara cardunculus var. scolymus TaxID=59895 RepID=A0A124SGR8_CYNCS|nr:BAHD acyltransferase At5g47980-like [Cynara cardunculus var. scolymus]KVI07273.1 Chloramphenicol acetyltransferase-like domain-containing protein [Cynara cardunculus var. scolymus]